MSMAVRILRHKSRCRARHRCNIERKRWCSVTHPSGGCPVRTQSRLESSGGDRYVVAESAFDITPVSRMRVCYCTFKLRPICFALSVFKHKSLSSGVCGTSRDSDGGHLVGIHRYGQVRPHPPLGKKLRDRMIFANLRAAFTC